MINDITFYDSETEELSAYIFINTLDLSRLLNIKIEYEDGRVSFNEEEAYQVYEMLGRYFMRKASSQ